MHSDELYHYGVKGMKWGVRKKRESGGGIGGAIRRKQRSNAERDLNDVRSKQRQVNSELRELRGYDKNPQGLAKSKISTAIRRSQIKSLEKTQASLKNRERDNVDALKELDEIEKYKQSKQLTPEQRAARNKKALKIGAAAVGTALAAYGTYKASKLMKEKAFDKAWKRASDASSKYISDQTGRVMLKYDFTRPEYKNAMTKLSRDNTRLAEVDYNYAKRASRNVIEAGKELLNKNREMPVAELLQMGISVGGFED